MSDPRFNGVTLHVGWWGGDRFVPGFPYSRTYVLKLGPLTHPTEWLDIAAGCLAPGDDIWCNQPILADAFPPERVRVWSKSGKSALLSAHPRAVTSKGILSTGELWMAIGEAWVDELTAER